MGRHFASKQFIKELDCQLYDNNFDWFLYFENKKLCGFASIEKRKGYYYLDNFYVFLDCRNKGIGKEIIKQIIEKYNNIKLISRNAIAINIFKKFGFLEYASNGRYKKLYFKKGV